MASHESIHDLLIEIRDTQRDLRDHVDQHRDYPLYYICNSLLLIAVALALNLQADPDPQGPIERPAPLTPDEGG